MSQILSITTSTELETVYDPCCAFPHAYVSDGFVSHNCVIIFDEVEKVFQSQSDSGVTSRMLSQLLWWLQSHKSKVFTVMTTNDMAKIPEELYREGRIDQTIPFLGIESYDEGCMFAVGALTNMLTQMKKDSLITEDNKKTLFSRLKVMFADGVCVPQSRITQAAYNLVKELVVIEKNGPVVSTKKVIKLGVV